MAIASLNAVGTISFIRGRYRSRRCDEEAAARSPYRTRSKHNASDSDCPTSPDRGGAICVHRPHRRASHGAGVRPTTRGSLLRPSLQYEKCDCQYTKLSCRYRDVCGRVGAGLAVLFAILLPSPVESRNLSGIAPNYAPGGDYLVSLAVRVRGFHRRGMY